MKSYLIDANVILRVLTGSPESQADQAARFLVAAENGDHEVIIPSMVIAEVVFVLSGSVYQIPRPLLVEQLLHFLSNPALHVAERDIIHRALSLFSKSNVDFVDCYLAAAASSEGRHIATFDKDFKKLGDSNQCLTLLQENIS